MSSLSDIDNPLTTRRNFIFKMSFLLGCSVSLPSIMRAASPHIVNETATTSPTTMHEVSELVTGKKLDEQLTSRCAVVLSKADTSFPHSLIALKEFISTNNIANIEALKQNAGFDTSLKKTAQQIIGALYLGFIGDPKSNTTEDDVRFITYTQAITYKLTNHYTHIPSYSRLKSGYWAHLPDPS